MRITFRFLTFIITLLVTTFPLGCSAPQESNTGEVIIGVTSTLRVGVDVLNLRQNTQGLAEAVSQHASGLPSMVLA